MLYPEWFEEPKSKCMACGKSFDGDPNAGEVGEPGTPSHAFLCPDCFAKHPEAKQKDASTVMEKG